MGMLSWRTHDELQLVRLSDQDEVTNLTYAERALYDLILQEGWTDNEFCRSYAKSFADAVAESQSGHIVELLLEKFVRPGDEGPDSLGHVGPRRKNAASSSRHKRRWYSMKHLLPQEREQQLATIRRMQQRRARRLHRRIQCVERMSAREHKLGSAGMDGILDAWKACKGGEQVQ